MNEATAIELGMLARRERDLLLRLENTRDRMKELRAKETPHKRGRGGKEKGPRGPFAF